MAEDEKNYSVEIEYADSGEPLSYESLSKDDSIKIYNKIKNAIFKNENFVEIFDIDDESNNPELLSVRDINRVFILWEE